MTPYEPARWRIRPTTAPGAPPGLLSAASFPGARSSSPPGPLPNPPAAAGPDEAERDAWDQMIRDRTTLKRETDDLHDKYDWMSLPAFLPVAAVAALEEAAMLTGPLLKPVLRKSPLNFPNKEWRFYAGNNRYAQAGQRAHAEFKQTVQKNERWKAEQLTPGLDGKSYRPDASNPQWKYNVDLKPKTPSGIRAGGTKQKLYESQGLGKTRIKYYDPDKYR